MAGGLVVLGLVAPDTLGVKHGHFLPQRIVLLGLVALVPWLDLEPGRRRSDWRSARWWWPCYPVGVRLGLRPDLPRTSHAVPSGGQPVRAWDPVGDAAQRDPRAVPSQPLAPCRRPDRRLDRLDLLDQLRDRPVLLPGQGPGRRRPPGRHLRSRRWRSSTNRATPRAGASSGATCSATTATQIQTLIEWGADPQLDAITKRAYDLIDHEGPLRIWSRRDLLRQGE